MMPAISLIPLPALPPFQFLPEVELNFGAVLEAVPAPEPQAPVAPTPSVPSETLPTFLGINPVKAQTVSPENSAVEDEMPVSTELFSGEGGSLAFNIEALALPPTLTPSREKVEDLRTTASPEAPNAPLPLQAFGLSQSKPRTSLNLEEKDSISAGSVRTELGVVPLPFAQPGSTDVKEPSRAQPIASAPTTDPLRFVVEHQLDLARDSRWLDALARDIVAVADKPDQLSFRLSPPQLGRLDVDVSSSDSGLSVRMNTSTEAAAQIVAAAQPRLIDELKNQGIRVAEAQVSTGGGQSQGQGQQHQRDADQMIEFARARFERASDTNLKRPTGRFA
jgi:flagellar hook-length control protein FliK